MSLFKKAEVAPPRILTRPDTATSPIAETPPPSLIPNSGLEASSSGPEAPTAALPPMSATEELFERITRTATAFLKMAEDEAVDQNGVPIYTLAERLRAFDAGSRWFERANKLKPMADEAAPGIELLRQIIADKDLANALEQQGFVRMPDSGESPSTKANRLRRQKVMKLKAAVNVVAAQEDDSQLLKMLPQKKTFTRTPEHIEKLRAGFQAHVERKRGEGEAPAEPEAEPVEEAEQ
jgi:hypothetical protein